MTTETARRRDWVCGLCGAGFDEKDEWADHLYEAHGETDEPSRGLGVRSMRQNIVKCLANDDLDDPTS